MKILFLYFTCEDIGVAMVTNMISQLQESFPLGRAAGSFEISFTEWLRGVWEFHQYLQNKHGRLGIRILSSSAESISSSLTRERYFQHSKIKFVSPAAIDYPLCNFCVKFPYCLPYSSCEVLYLFGYKPKPIHYYKTELLTTGKLNIF